MYERRFTWKKANWIKENPVSMPNRVFYTMKLIVY